MVLALTLATVVWLVMPGPALHRRQPWSRTPSRLGLSRLTAPSRRAHHRAMQRQSTTACDLLAAVVASGADTASAISSVGAALGSPLGDELARVAARLRMGATAREAWRALMEVTALEPLTSAMVRSAESGAPLVESLRRAACDQRARERSHLIARARVLGVRTVLPLGLCFLPAFILLGIVPVVASLVSTVLGR